MSDDRKVKKFCQAMIAAYRLHITRLFNLATSHKKSRLLLRLSPWTRARAGLWLLYLIVEVVETAVYSFYELRWGMCHFTDNAPKYRSFGMCR